MKNTLFALLLLVTCIGHSQTTVSVGKSGFNFKSTQLYEVVSDKKAVPTIYLNTNEMAFPVSNATKAELDKKASKADIIALQNTVEAQAKSIISLTKSLTSFQDSVFNMQNRLASRAVVQDTSKIHALRQELNDAKSDFMGKINASNSFLIKALNDSMSRKENILPWIEYTDKFKITRDSIIHIDLR
jgi:hypothetical protein